MTQPGLLLLRESAAVARRPRAFLRRAVVLVLLALIVLVAWSVSAPAGGTYSSQALGELARALTNAFFIGLGIVLVFVMPGASAGLIAGEREEGSLELLRMTPLGPGRIVAEKLLSRIAVALQLVVLAGPLFCTPLFFGGVTGRDIATAVLFPLGAAAWMAGLGIACSALHRRAAPAVLWTYLAALAWHVLGSGAASLLELPAASTATLLLLPLWTFLVLPATQNLFLGRPDLLWQAPLAAAAFASACAAFAGWQLDREDAAGGGRAGTDTAPRARAEIRGSPFIWKEIRTGHASAVRRLLVAALALGGFATLWALAYRWPIAAAGDAVSGSCIASGVAVAAGGLLGAAWPRRRRFYWTVALVAAAAGLALWGSAFAVTPRESANPGLMTAQVVLYPLVVALVLLMLLGAAVSGATAVVHERVRKTIDALRMTPLPARAFIIGKTAGCAWTLLPAAAALLVDVALLWLIREMPASAGALLLAVVACTLYAVIAMGLLVSARSRRPAQAVIVSIGILAGYLFIVPLVALLLSRGNAELVGWINPIYWIVELLTDYPAERRFATLAGGSLLFCAGAAAVGLGLEALAAKAFESER
jgi:ABC-type transport system involved in multi-copper enzyme maturation permease subunit